METHKVKKILDAMNDELNIVSSDQCSAVVFIVILQTKQKLLDLKKQDNRNRETIGKLRKQKVIRLYTAQPQ